MCDDIGTMVQKERAGKHGEPLPENHAQEDSDRIFMEAMAFLALSMPL